MGVASQRKGAHSDVWVDGERQIGTGVSVARDDKWHIGSITKSMTATLVARLVADGAVKWDQTVGEILGKGAPDMHPVYRSASFKHLLSHRSGLPRDIPFAEFSKFSREPINVREERIAYTRLALSMEPNGPIESDFHYSNNGYVVVGSMLETKLGKSWEELISLHVFERLKLATAGFGAPGRSGAIDHPVGHARSGDELTAYPVGEPITDNPAALGPAGRVHISLAELLTYLEGHRDRSSFLPAKLWSMLHTAPFGGDYALGWRVLKNGSLWHNGSNTLWYAEAMVDRSSGFVAAAAVNTGDLQEAVPAVSTVLLEAAGM